MIKKFLDYIENNRSKSTRNNYEAQLKTWFPDGKMDLTLPYISEQFNQWKTSEITVAHLYLRLNVLYLLAKYVNAIKPIPHIAEITKICKRIKVNVGELHLIPQDKEILALKQLLKKRKHLIILSLMANAGLRISEIVNLNLGDVKNNKVLIKNTTQQSRYIILPNQLSKEIEKYIEVYHLDSKDDNEPLFYGENEKQRFPRNSFQKLIHRHCKNLGINSITCDSLRYSIAKHVTVGINFDEAKNYLYQNSKISEGIPLPSLNLEESMNSQNSSSKSDTAWFNW